MKATRMGSSKLDKKKIFTGIKILFIRKHLREITFIGGPATFGDCLEILSFLLFKRKKIINGRYIRQFENEFAKYIGAKYAFSFGAGRMAFYAILKAMDIKEGDEIILPAYTCVVVPNAIIYCGAKPVYVDINPDTFTIDVNKIEEKITHRTKAIVAQHMFNHLCDMDVILKIAKKYNLRVIEDCAHALGGEYKGRKAGNFGDAAFFTMDGTKIISTRKGGVAVTNDVELADKLRKIENDTEFPSRKETLKIVLSFVISYFLGHPAIFFIGKYLLWLLGRLGILIPGIAPEEKRGEKPLKYPVRLTNIQAKIGLRQLANIEANLKHRREIAKIYEEVLKEIGINIKSQDGYNPPHIRFAFLVKDRQKLKEIFQNNQIELGDWFNSPIHPKGSSLEPVHYQMGSCPVAEFVAEHCANLPTDPKVGEKDVKRIARLLRQHSTLLLNPEKDLEVYNVTKL